LTAAYVLGALAPGERRQLEAHLDGCSRCRDEVLAFSPLPALLGRVTLEELEGAAIPDRSAAVVAAARSDLRRLRTSRRRWRLAAAAAALLAAVAVGSALVSSGGDGQGGARRGVELALSSQAGIDGAIVADERPWGTYVHVALTDLPTRAWYELWLVDQSGQWHPAGSWGPTSQGRANLGSSTSLRLAEIDRLVVTSGDRQDQLATAAA
jgi:anti-sigma-K factor RskA